MIVGSGFAGYQTARTLLRKYRGAADVVLINPTDYFLYLPLLPEVAGGVLDPRRVTVPLTDTLPGVRLVLGRVDGVGVAARTVSYTGPEGVSGVLGYHRLVLPAGSVNKLLPIPGVADHAHGFRGIPEALHLRDHVIRQIELADAAEDPVERAARLTSSPGVSQMGRQWWPTARPFPAGPASRCPAATSAAGNHDPHTARQLGNTPQAFSLVGLVNSARLLSGTTIRTSADVEQQHTRRS